MNNFLDIPYIKDGRSFCGVDCYGLCWLFAKENGVTLPPFLGEDIYSVSSVSDLISNKKTLFKRVDKSKVQKLDIVLFNIKGSLTHVGIMISHDTFLHVFEGGSKHSEILKISGNSWERRVDSFWRFIA